MTKYLQTNESLLTDLGKRIEQLRIRKNLTQAELAKEAGVGKRTLERIENGHSAQLSTFISILRALGLVDHLIDLIPNQQNSPMALLLGEKKTRYRASKPSFEKPSKEWVWKEDQ